MALVGPAMAAELLGTLTGAGLIGPSLPFFCSALGLGLVSATVGQTFTTTDTGSGPSAGIGVGVGLTLAPTSAMKAAMLVEGLSKGFVPTPEAEAVYDAIATAYTNQLALATLTSTHTPVFLGSGTVVPGSIPITKASASGIVGPLGQGLGMLGDSWLDFSDVVCAGIEVGILAAAGTVVITGAPPPTPAPATGSGSGIIS